MTIFIGLIAAMLGFGVSVYIQNKQHTQRPMMCPRKSPCEAVVTSPQSKLIGISNTTWGMVYYIAVFMLLTWLGAGNTMSWLPWALLLLSAFGFAFSLYLLWVQYFKIKQWCVWCLGSSAAATVLFVVGLLVFF